MSRRARLAVLGAASTLVSLGLLTLLAPVHRGEVAGRGARGEPASPSRPAPVATATPDAAREGPRTDPSAGVVVATLAGAPANGVADEDRLATEAARRQVVSAIEESVQARVSVRWSESCALLPAHLRVEGAAPMPGSALVVARGFVSDVLLALGCEHSIALGIGMEPPARGRALVPARTFDTGESSIVDYEAFVDSVPIEGGTLKVELRKTAEGLVPVCLGGRFHPAVRASGSFSPAVESAVAHKYSPVEIGNLRADPVHRPVVQPTPDGSYRKAFEVTAHVSATEARREVVDGETGATLDSYPMTCDGSAAALTYELDPSATPRTSHPLPGLYVTDGTTTVVTDAAGGHGLSGTVALHKGLNGPLLRIIPDGYAALTYTGGADFTLLPSASDEGTYHQDEVSAFSFAMTYNAYMKKTYTAVAGAASVRFPALVDSGFPNAFFSPTPVSTTDGEHFSGYFDFGIIYGHPTTRDGSVVKHEYTHALLNGLAYLYGSKQAAGLNEGLADYFPCAQAESPLVGAWVLPPYMRSLEHAPKKFVWPSDAPSLEAHKIGNIFNQALWEARLKAEATAHDERLKIDQAVLGGVLRMPSTPTLLEAREAILAADTALYGGSHVALLETAFADHGIGDPPATPPPPAPDSTPPPASTPTPPPPPPPPPSSAPVFLYPKGAGYGFPLGATIMVGVAADGAGATTTLAASPLANSMFTTTAGTTAIGTFTFKPDASQLGMNEVTFTATNGAGATTKKLLLLVLGHK
ncbi:M36 family metallopeptidase [bacterium]|nr:M36 family metallopeptidase [bacterium]